MLYVICRIPDVYVISMHVYITRAFMDEQTS